MTIKDIARLAHVSIATVSRSINNKGVSKKTKEKVLKIVEEYAYYPNSFARYLGQRNGSRFTRKKCNRLH